MESFTDKNNLTWILDINVFAVKTVRAVCNVDLVNVISINDNSIDTQQLQNIADDPCKFVSILYALCEKKIKERNMSEEEFAMSFDYDTIDRAMEALVREIINFTPPVKRKVLTMLFQKTREYQKQAEKKMEQMMETEQFKKEMDKTFEEMFLNTPTSSQEL